MIVVCDFSSRIKQRLPGNISVTYQPLHSMVTTIIFLYCSLSNSNMNWIWILWKFVKIWFGRQFFLMIWIWFDLRLGNFVRIWLKSSPLGQIRNTDWKRLKWPFRNYPQKELLMVNSYTFIVYHTINFHYHFLFQINLWKPSRRKRSMAKWLKLHWHDLVRFF